ncbi:MAG: site-specific DNA-methyltransferase [Firmicutes bacterium]|nr:site-specific DNA-methyltransferase [Candidatus Caballimonas caccae]
MSTNISKQKREELLREIGEIRNKLKENADENTNQLLVYLSNIEKDIDGKKYGLVFEEHREAVDELLEKNVPVLIEDESLKIDNGGTQNFLIEGDNLASLKLLEKTHKGEIDLIYIDPPYNTGNKDFIYDDAFVDSEDKFKHSKWLSFMKARLEIAHRLLSDKGVIFISIDDKEQAQLKILCDSIFGEENFESFIWKKKGGAGNTEKIIGCLTEYIVCYFKKKKAGIFNYRQITRIYKYTDKNGQYNLEGIEKTNSGIYKRPTMLFDIIDPKTNRHFSPTKGMRWTVGEKNIQEMIKNNQIFFDYKKNKVYRIKREKDYEETNNVYYNLMIDCGSLTTAKTEIETVLGNRELFDTPKPIDLIIELLKIGSKKDTKLLDFFAGSGTTGHAVMKLNAEDGGNRKFILCTYNENNICREVTYERIKRVIDKENYKASLKYMKVGFEPISDKVYYEYADKLLLHVKELVELENGLDFENNKKVAITLTDEDLTAFVNSLGEETTFKAVYVGHDVFVSPIAEEKLKSLEIAINRIPDYYYSELRG